MFLRKSWLLAMVVGAACAVPTTVAHAGPLPDTDYVALGDSAASGPLVLPIDLTSLGCNRSDANYPTVAAGLMQVQSLNDVTCDGADLDDVHHPKSTDFGSVPPQMDAVTAGTDLVTLNAMLRTTAAANGAGYVDLATPSVGHDMCRSPGTRWVEPLIPGNIAAPLHPNNAGMVGFARAVVATVAP